MNTEIMFHLLEIVILGAPLWYGAIKMSVIHKEFPPHIHENGNIRFPTGMEPGNVQKVK